MRLVAGLDEQFEGTVSGIGKVGFVFQEPTLLPWRSLLDNITITTGCTAITAQTALDQVDLGTRSKAYPNQLSLGQQRRVSLARALAVNPQTLILDEAFASLDEATATKMRNLTQRLLKKNRFRTLLVTHSLEEAAMMADRVLLLQGSPAQITLDHAIQNPPTNRNHQSEIARLRARIVSLGSKPVRPVSGSRG